MWKKVQKSFKTIFQLLQTSDSVKVDPIKSGNRTLRARVHRIEPLEARELLSVTPIAMPTGTNYPVGTNYIIVNSDLDSAQGTNVTTLREAINYANDESKKISVIYFADTLSEVNIESNLPTITNNYDLIGNQSSPDVWRSGNISFQYKAPETAPSATLVLLTVSGGSAADKVCLSGIDFNNQYILTDEDGEWLEPPVLELCQAVINSGYTELEDVSFNYFNSEAAVITNTQTGKIQATSCRFIGNYSAFVAGIYNDGGAVNVYSSSFCGNFGIGMYNASGTTFVANSLFCGNDCSGSVINAEGTTTVVNCTIVGNTVGIANTVDATFNIYNTICALNKDSGQIRNYGYGGNVGITASNNLIPETVETEYTGAKLFVDSSPWDNQWGTGVASAVKWKSWTPILSGGDAIDKGLNDKARDADGAFLSFDWGGNARLMKGTASAETEVVDMGCWESSSPISGVIQGNVTFSPGSLSSSSEIPVAIASITDWDTFYVELWISADQFYSANSFQVKLEWDSSLFRMNGIVQTYNNTIANWTTPTKTSETGLTSTFTLVKFSQIAVTGGFALLGQVCFSPNTDQKSNLSWQDPSPTTLKIDGNSKNISVQGVPYDLDGNSVIDMQDFIAFAKEFNKPITDDSDPLTRQANFDGGDKVDMADFILFATNFNKKRANVGGRVEIPVKKSAASASASDLEALTPVAAALTPVAATLTAESVPLTASPVAAVDSVFGQAAETELPSESVVAVQEGGATELQSEETEEIVSRSESSFETLPSETPAPETPDLIRAAHAAIFADNLSRLFGRASQYKFELGYRRLENSDFSILPTR